MKINFKAIIVSIFAFGSPVAAMAQSSNPEPMLEGAVLTDYQNLQHQMASAMYNFEWSGIESFIRKNNGICAAYSTNNSKGKFPIWVQNTFTDFCDFGDKLSKVFGTDKPNKSVNYCKPLKSLKQSFDKGRGTALFASDGYHGMMSEGIEKAFNYEKEFDYGTGWWGVKTVKYSCK